MAKNDVPLLILGAGKFAVEVADIVSQVKGFRVEGFVQSLDPSNASPWLQELPVHWVDDIGRFARTHLALGAMGDPRRKQFIGQVADCGIDFATVVHPGAMVSASSDLGPGTLVGPGAVVGAATRVGCHVILNRGVLIGHHCDLADYVTLGPGVKVAGRCNLGEQCFLGIGSTICDGLTLGPRSVVGAGSVVTKSVAEGVRVFGVPAKVIRPAANAE